MAFTLLAEDDEPKAPKGGFVLLPEEERSGGEKLARGTGLATRAVASGVMGLPNMVGDALNTAINYGVRGVNAVTGANVPELGMPSEVTQRAMDSAGLPQAQTGAERMVFNHVAPAVVGGGGVAKIAEQLSAKFGPGVAKGILDIMGKEQGLQAAGNVSGSVAGGATAEAGGGPMAQFIASLVGGAAPATTKYLAASGTRGAVRGGEEGRQQYNDRLQTFDDAGVSPSAGQASGARRMQATESTLAKVPGAAGVFAAQGEAEAAQMGAKINAIADSMIPNVDAAKAGRTIEKGFKGFVDRFRSEQEFLYSKVDQHIAPSSQVSVGNVGQALADIARPIAGAPNISAGMTNPTIVKLGEMLAADAPNGTLPYQAVKELRTTIGEKISSPKLTDDVGTAQWKRIYAALSEDMGAAAQQAGPDAERAFARANAYTRAGHERIETTLNRVSGKDTAEKVFQAAINPSELREGATTLNAVMRSLNPDERKVVTAATIKRMGQATAGNQSADGDLFSTNTFLTNWNKVDEAAKRVLFPDQGVRDGMEALAQSSGMIKEGSKVFANPSGTSSAGVSIGAGVAAVLNPALGAKIAVGLAGAWGAAKLLTNPGFVRWVGRATRMSPSALPVAMQQITAESQGWSPDDRAALADLVRKLTQ